MKGMKYVAAGLIGAALAVGGYAAKDAYVAPDALVMQESTEDVTASKFIKYEVAPREGFKPRAEVKAVTEPVVALK